MSLDLVPLLDAVSFAFSFLLMWLGLGVLVAIVWHLLAYNDE